MKRMITLSLLAVLCLFAAIFPASAEEEMQDMELYLTLDSYPFQGGMLTITADDLDGNPETFETGAMDFVLIPGMTVKEVLAEADIHDVTVASEWDILEGWMEYRVIATDVGDGTFNYTHELVSGDTLYTTEEMLARTLPENNVAYVAKWAELPVEEYFIDEGFDWASVIPTGIIYLHGNGGQLSFKEWDETYTVETYAYWVDVGLSLHEMLNTPDVYYAKMTDIAKEGATLTGWTIYTGPDILWTDTRPEGEDILCLLDSMTDGEPTYIVLEDYTVYSESATTEELHQIVCNGEHYIAVANWE